MGRRTEPVAAALLRRLEGAAGGIPPERLAAEMGVSGSGVARAIASLRAWGFAVERSALGAYRLVWEADTPCAASVQPLLSTARLGRDWVYRDEVDSTNRCAAEQAAAGARHGLVVAADAQTQGKGRQGRQWHSPRRRNLYVSILLRPPLKPARMAQLPLVAALALRRALGLLCPAVPAGVKWPNDLWVRGRKLAGILCESEADSNRVRHVVVGVGLNVNLAPDEWPPDLLGRATSLRCETGRPWPRPQVLAAFLNQFEPLLEHWQRVDDLGPYLTELEAASVLRGRRVLLETGQAILEGTALGIAEDGRLRLRTDTGAEVCVSSGDAHLTGP